MRFGPVIRKQLLLALVMTGLLACRDEMNRGEQSTATPSSAASASAPATASASSATVPTGPRTCGAVPADELLTIGKRRVELRPKVRWRVIDPSRFRDAALDESKTCEQIATAVASAMRWEIAAAKYADVVANDRDPLYLKLTKRCSSNVPQAGGQGFEIVGVSYDIISTGQVGRPLPIPSSSRDE